MNINHNNKTPTHNKKKTKKEKDAKRDDRDVKKTKVENNRRGEKNPLLSHLVSPAFSPTFSLGDRKE
jgi:hypothetical protein